MKKILNSIIWIIIILSILIGIDLYSIYKHNKPVFILKEEKEGLDYIYRGFIYDTYNCAEYSMMQIKLKSTKYSCPKQEEDNKDNEKNFKKTAKLSMAGDLLFESPYYNAINAGEDKDKYFNKVKKYFINDDLSIGNMEVVIGNDALKVSGDGYNFCAPEYIGDLVNSLDFEVLGTSNNHAYDRGKEGLLSTINYFKNKTDIITVGTYKDKNDRDNLRILNINNIKFGFLAYTYGTNQKPTEDNVNLIGYYKNPNTKEINKNLLKNEIDTLKSQSDVVIVLMHWGNEFTFDINDEQKEIANYLNSLGVDIIVGSHSHNIHPIEIIGDEHKTLVYYSLGNFTSHDDDIARTKPGYETFDNAYQVGMISTINVSLEDNKISFDNINTELVVNYFDKDMRNFELIPFNEYNNEYEINHHRYNKGLTKEFINEIYKKVIKEEYRTNYE